MAFEVGMKVKAICANGEIYVGTLKNICVGICKEEPTQASIILSEDKNNKITYGQVHLWCNGLKSIEQVREL